MKRVLLIVFSTILFFNAQAQVSTTVVAGDYKIINIGTDTYGDFTHALILLHQMYILLIKSLGISRIHRLGTCSLF